MITKEIKLVKAEKLTQEGNPVKMKYYNNCFENKVLI